MSTTLQPVEAPTGQQSLVHLVCCHDGYTPSAVAFCGARVDGAPEHAAPEESCVVCVDIHRNAPTRCPKSGAPCSGEIDE